MCKEFKTKDGLEGFESITKIPKGEEEPGMDYVYFLNMRNYEEQQLYQIRIKVFEMSPTGTRDNLLMHPLSDITNLDITEISELYRKDPYDENYSSGNVRNISEMEDFDSIFRYHPLSIIRGKIRPRALKMLAFAN